MPTIADSSSGYIPPEPRTVLVFATPLHFYAWSSPMKALTDRLYCLTPQFKRNLKEIIHEFDTDIKGLNIK